jgi:long-chain fatty acid transport protein
MLDGEVQGILPRTVTESDYDLANGTYTLIIGGAHFHVVVRFGKGGKPGKKQPSAPEPQPTA